MGVVCKPFESGALRLILSSPCYHQELTGSSANTTNETEDASSEKAVSVAELLEKTKLDGLDNADVKEGDGEASAPVDRAELNKKVKGKCPTTVPGEVCLMSLMRTDPALLLLSLLVRSPINSLSICV